MVRAAAGRDGLSAAVRFYPVQDARYHAILASALAGFVAMVLFVIITLDRPFRGPMAIPADSYQLVYDQLMNN